MGSLGVGLIMNKTGKYRILGLIVTTSICLGAGLISTMNLNTPDWQPVIYLFLVGFGYGGTLTVTLRTYNFYPWFFLDPNLFQHI